MCNLKCYVESGSGGGLPRVSVPKDHVATKHASIANVQSVGLHDNLTISEIAVQPD